jgi:hypothetical protein
VALFAHAYGFLAVFAAGAGPAAHRAPGGGEETAPADVRAAAAAPATARRPTRRRSPPTRKTPPAYLAGAVLSFNEQLERILEVTLVLLLGGMLTRHLVPPKRSGSCR